MESREQYIQRLNEFAIPHKNSWNYIHYYTYFSDLKKVIDMYIREGSRVFDIGCGNKPFEQYIRTLIKSNEPDYYVGCDVVQSSEQKVDIICSATDIPVKESMYDIVICTQVVEHVFEHEKIFKEAYRLLKPGGVFIVSGPFVFEMHEIPYDFYRFTKYGFQNLLSNAGFEIIEEFSNGGNWATVGQVILEVIKDVKGRSLLRRILRRCIIRFCNWFFLMLENRDKDSKIFALNYVFVGKK